MMFEEPENLWQDYDSYKDMSTDEEVLNAGCLHLVPIVLMMAVGLILCALLVSCRSVRTVEVDRVRTDTTYITKTQRDSVWLHDSIYMKEWLAGDTVYQLRDRWHTKFVEKLKTDTFYYSKTDSIPVPYPVERIVEVEKRLTWWQQTRLYLANIVLLFLGGGLAMTVLRRVIRFL